MRQFEFQQGTPRYPFMSAPPIIVRRDVTAKYNDFYYHMVPYEA